MGVITFIKDCYFKNYVVKKASSNNGIDGSRVGKQMNKTKILIKTMNTMWFERHDEEKMTTANK